MMSHMEWGWGGMIFGPIVMVAVIVVVVLQVRWLFNLGRGGASHNFPLQTPLDVLKQRFAKGEIDKGEFEERRRVLVE